tara:strand:- start:1220 stop:1945 length:726 start_codon:yes stop_codon:yes gene_type:complete
MMRNIIFNRLKGKNININIHINQLNTMAKWNILLVDSSASMTSNKNSVESGILTLFMEQKDNTDRFTFLTFNTDVNHIIDAKFNEIDCQHLINSITNKGFTAMYDAVGYVYEMIIDQFVENISFTIITDGYENSSKIHTLDSLKDLRKSIDEKCNLNFSFICESDGVLTDNSAIISHANESCEVSGDYTKAFRSVSRSMSTPRFPSINPRYSVEKKNESGSEPLIKRQISYSKKKRPRLFP